MGRGQAAIVKDRFSTVFGERRGSQAAQEERDREEAEDLIRHALNPSNPITLSSLAPIMDLFTCDDGEIRALLADGVVANYRENSMQALAITMGDADIASEVRDFLRVLAVDYFTRDHSIYGAPTQKRSEGKLFLQYYFNEAPVRSYEEIERDLPLIRALARIYRGGDPGAAKMSCEPLLDYLIPLQHDELLPLFAPWVKAICQEVKSKRCDSHLDNPLFAELLRGGWSLASGSGESPLRKKVFAPLREAVTEAQSRVWGYTQIR